MHVVVLLTMPRDNVETPSLNFECQFGKIWYAAPSQVALVFTNIFMQMHGPTIFYQITYSNFSLEKESLDN
jgi:hypothetical protein